MHIVLQVSSENHASQKIFLRPGEKINIGRSNRNDFAFPDDTQMSREHFSIELTDTVCQLSNLKRKIVTTINGLQIEERSEVHDGDEIVAGQTSFKVTLVGVPAASSPTPVQPVPEVPEQPTDEPDSLLADQAKHDPPEVFASELFSDSDNFQSAGSEPERLFDEPVQSESVSAEHDPGESAPGEPDQDLPLDDVKESVLSCFRQLPEPLFAILDAARDPMVFVLLMQSDHEYQSLYEGEKGDTLAAVAPYLVKLPSESSLLKQIVALGWGESWGIYLTSDQAFNDVRKHFRKFLMVKTDEGKEVYFRFYDPRVLRVFLPTCLPQEAEQFFGPVTSYYCEDETPEKILRLAAGKNGTMKSVQLIAESVLQIGEVK